MHEETHVLAGECTVVNEEGRERRGEMVVVCKPDDTVLVHDAEGYQPVDWLTRPEALTLSAGTLTATDGDRCLRVEMDGEYDRERYAVSSAGTPVGDCPDCDGCLVRDGATVTCLDCRTAYGVPRDASVLDSDCDCGRPRIRVERGRAFEVCLDRDCESLDEAVRAAFDREWDCPNCDGDLRVLRRGGLLAGCEHYPDCDTGWGIPTGTVVDTCACGLPVFETASGRRCLDSGCELASRAAANPP